MSNPQTSIQRFINALNNGQTVSLTYGIVQPNDNPDYPSEYGHAVIGVTVGNGDPEYFGLSPATDGIPGEIFGTKGAYANDTDFVVNQNDGDFIYGDMIPIDHARDIR